MQWRPTWTFSPPDKMNQNSEDSAKLAAVSTCNRAQLSPSPREADAMLSTVRCVAWVRTPGSQERLKGCVVRRWEGAGRDCATHAAEPMHAPTKKGPDRPLEAREEREPLERDVRHPHGRRLPEPEGVDFGLPHGQVRKGPQQVEVEDVVHHDAETAAPGQAAQGGGALDGTCQEGLDGEQRHGAEAGLRPPEEHPEAACVCWGSWGA